MLYALTVISAIFVPANFLAAIEGMNFDVMPELHLRWGYVGWWAVVFVVWAVFGFFMWRWVHT